MTDNPSGCFYSVLQISDSGFPVGSFSHSAGYEASSQYGLVNTKDDLRILVQSTLENEGSQKLPYIQEAYHCSQTWEDIERIERHLDVSLTNQVANRASVQQGRSLLAAAESVFQLRRLGEYLQRVEEGTLYGHHPVTFGILCRQLDIPVQTCLGLYLFGILRTILNSAVRMGTIVGTMEAQALQHELQRVLPDVISRNRSRTLKDASLSFPVTDTVQNVHDTLFCRLFQS